jgi:predicted TIM-barrel fold metal-dependent hydrolase
MAMTVDTARRMSLDDVLVVDVDVHAHETPEVLRPYIDPSWRAVMENLRKVPHRYLDMPAFCPNNDPRLPGASLPAPHRGRIQIVWTAEQMRRELSEFSIDIGIIFPDNLLSLAGLPRAEYATALARAYHRWLKDRWLHTDNGLYGMIVAAPQDPEASAREIAHWANDDRFVGVYLPTSLIYPLWGHHRYNPIYDMAQRHNLPVFLHSVGGRSSAFPFNIEQFYTSIPPHIVSHTFAMMANLMSMMETGVPVRYPHLRLCFTEAGLTWVPFLRLRLDKEYGENRYLWPHFDDRPSKWINGFYFGTQPVEEPENPRDLVDLIRIYNGEDTTVFASDWPHHDFDHPRAVFDLPVSDLMKRKIMGANALKLLPKVKVPLLYQGHYRQGQSLS